MVVAGLLAAFLLGFLLAGLFALGQRAGNGRGTPRPAAARRCAPPYDWAREVDL